MSEIIRTISLAAVIVGAAWVMQTAGLGRAGLLSISPAFLFLGAIIGGAGLGAITWMVTTIREPSESD